MQLWFKEATLFSERYNKFTKLVHNNFIVLKIQCNYGMFQKLTMCFSKRFPLIMNNQNPHCWTFLQDWRHMSDGESDTAWNNTQYVFTQHFKNKLKKWIPLAESNIQLNLADSYLLLNSKNLFRTNYLFPLKKTSAYQSEIKMNSQFLKANIVSLQI